MDHIMHSHRGKSKRRTTVNCKEGQCLSIRTDRYVQRLEIYYGGVLSSRGDER